MAFEELTDEALQHAIDKIQEAYDKGYRKGGSPSAKQVACRALGISHGTFDHRMRVARDRGMDIPETPNAPGHESITEIPEGRPDVFDASFWRKRAGDLQSNLDRAEHMIEQLGGATRIPVRLPKWKPRKAIRGKSRSVVCGLVSDIHDGEHVTADAVAGINEYNPDIAEDRLKRFGQAMCEIGPRWTEDTDCNGAMLTVNGDLISGDIHEELMMTNSLTSLEQVMHCAKIVGGLMNMLLETYDTLHVVGTPGNHGRTTKKSTAKLYPNLSYDTLIMAQIAEKFEGDDRVTFQIGATDQLTPVLNDVVFTTHGDKIGTGGGQGFAGPMLPVLRGSKKVLEQQGSMGRQPSVIQLSHFHKVGNPYIGDVPVFANGSVVGYSEYASDIRASIEPPMQWMYLIHERWGVRERLPVMLEDPIREAA